MDDLRSAQIVTPAAPADWRVGARLRLCELLNHRDLERLLGDLLTSARATLRRRKGHDTSGSKDDLARALLLVHHEDLLTDGEVRETIARRCGVRPPSRWHPGKAGAFDFVRQCHLPLALAGIPASERHRDIEYVDAPVRLPPLADFQEEVSAGLLQEASQPRGRAIVSLPTGAGKTRTAVESIHRLLARPGIDQRPRPYAIVWLAHTEELCEQALACFRQVWAGLRDGPPVALVRFWGAYTTSDELLREALGCVSRDFSVVVSTPQRLANILRGTEDMQVEGRAALLQRAGVIVVDEAHRAAAPTYRDIIQAFSLSTTASVVGLTATPFRREYEDAHQGTRELRSLFRRLIEARRTLGDAPLDLLQARGVLARPEVHDIVTRQRVQLQPTLFDEALPTEERLDDEINTLVDTHARRREILKALLVESQFYPEMRMVYFAPSVHDARCMAYLLEESGVSAAVVTGGTRVVTRRRVIDDFRGGRVQVLCNCEVLTTGFDDPRVTHVVMSRTTVSQVLYEQMVGRGLRGPAFGGTEVCRVLDCIDEYEVAPRLTLGYRAFREVWRPARRASTRQSHGGRG